MKLPSKIISYKESVISKLFPILLILQNADTDVFALYEATNTYFISIEEFMDTLDCLFALKRISYDTDRGVIHYVA